MFTAHFIQAYSPLCVHFQMDSNYETNRKKYWSWPIIICPRITFNLFSIQRKRSKKIGSGNIDLMGSIIELVGRSHHSIIIHVNDTLAFDFWNVNTKFMWRFTWCTYQLYTWKKNRRSLHIHWNSPWIIWWLQRYRSYDFIIFHLKVHVLKHNSNLIPISKCMQQ